MSNLGSKQYEHMSVAVIPVNPKERRSAGKSAKNGRSAAVIVRPLGSALEGSLVKRLFDSFPVEQATQPIVEALRGIAANG